MSGLERGEGSQNFFHPLLGPAQAHALVGFHQRSLDQLGLSGHRGQDRIVAGLRQPAFFGIGALQPQSCLGRDAGIAIELGGPPQQVLPQLRQPRACRAAWELAGWSMSASSGASQFRLLWDRARPQCNLFFQQTARSRLVRAIQRQEAGINIWRGSRQVSRKVHALACAPLAEHGCTHPSWR